MIDRLRNSGGLPGVRDQGRLESAALRPENAEHCGETDLLSLAALDAAGVIWNHPFLDGDARAGWVACELVLLANGVGLTANNSEALAATLLLAGGDLTEDQFADWLRDMSAPAPG